MQKIATHLPTAILEHQKCMIFNWWFPGFFNLTNQGVFRISTPAPSFGANGGF
jgi:hypothetical protein